MSEVHFPTGGGGDGTAYAYIKVTYPAGFRCTARKGSRVITAKESTGTYIFQIPESGTWKITATNGAISGERNVVVDTAMKIYNANIAFNIPSAYQEIESIQYTGTQRINAGIYPGTDVSIEFDAICNSGKLFEGSDSWPVKAVAANSGEWGYYYDASSYVVAPLTANVRQTVYMTWPMSNSTINGAPATPTTHGTAKTFAKGSYPINLFAYNRGGSYGEYGTGTLYHMKIYESSVIKRNFFPCYRKSDNVIGLYDTVNNIFYTNEGTGTFIAGPDV